ncbi:uncharacterized protein Smp_203080 [Schistosoma mansoni]|uniref:uncharacterized protein n=1 Tax=Schistosoma mansoni TaxID=6183 RepID=UPI00022DC4E8|nr:uncharacterized protein Smp_203080 [Schistosoma mansoni]|eukprot:XP_018653398.1 uncharacterized protein Smp_203080 [Schistosoma mansoni]
MSNCKQAKQRRCVLEMAGKPTHFKQALTNIYRQAKMSDGHMMNKIRSVHICAHIKSTQG